MKNIKNLVWKTLAICIIMTSASCEKNAVEAEPLTFLKTDISDKTERYDEYSMENPKEDGIHVVAKNEQTGSVLSVRIRRGNVVGFQILKKDQNLVLFTKRILPDPQNLPPFSPDFCPDGWKEKLICYVNKDGIPVSYVQCTPTTITIGLEPEW